MTNRTCPPRALTVAGSDSGGGAGIQADLKTFQSFGCFGMSAVTALTAQNSVGVSGVYKVSGEFVRQQMEAVFGDIGVDALKCGMLADSEIIRAVAEVLARYPDPPLVLDTVLVAKSGDPLLEDEAVQVMVERLFPRALVITPNATEAGKLVGFDVTDEETMHRAANALRKMGARGVLVKGGHLKGDKLVDLLALPDGQIKLFGGKRIDTENTHGTGCTLSAGIAACLAHGLALEDAVRLGREYVAAGIQKSFPTGRGYGTLSHEPFAHRLREF
ncbi:MAG TPA: bifunctional hydroxymethylpyrimidine kinase/phosphomethylpyrimidine kinase [Candidatus Glassbacteria bacterium]|nr:bifunctional hydroxymethylpyrimidine kinase/phosphomethylpyrimidine kinase [Candidatus Glassbacteria bacterium]